MALKCIGGLICGIISDSGGKHVIDRNGQCVAEFRETFPEIKGCIVGLSALALHGNKLHACLPEIDCFSDLCGRLQSVCTGQMTEIVFSLSHSLSRPMLLTWQPSG